MRWGRLSDAVDNAKGLTYKSTLFFIFSIEEIQLFAIELNTGSPNNFEYGQLFLHGVDASDTPLIEIGGEYAPITKDIKRSEGLPFDRVTLYQDGDFYRTFEFIQNQEGFIIKADTLKEGEDLQDRWGHKLVGLTNESITELAKEVLPFIIEYILSEILS